MGTFRLLLITATCTPVWSASEPQDTTLVQRASDVHKEFCAVGEIAQHLGNIEKIREAVMKSPAAAAWDFSKNAIATSAATADVVGPLQLLLMASSYISYPYPCPLTFPYSLSR